MSGAKENTGMNEETVTTEQQNNEEIKTFTEEEVQKMIQAEADKRVNQALDKKQAQWQAEQEAKIAEEKRQAQLSEEEKWQEKFKAQVQQFESERQEFQQAKLKAETLELLSNEGLPTSFVSFVMGTDSETTQANIQSFKQTWIENLQAEVNDRLKGKTPTVSNASNNMTKEEFNKMTYQQKQEVLERNPNYLK